MANQSQIIFTNEVVPALEELLRKLASSDVFVLTDSNTVEKVWPLLRDNSPVLQNAHVITIPGGEINKDIRTVETVWQALVDNGASRNAVLVNVGGGLVSDLGGFAAATFKRGIHCINIPTTLLSAVDASVGGKTGVNFAGAKNLIGTFSQPYAVIVSGIFFNTLPYREILSGYGEMLKHAMLSNLADTVQLLSLTPEAILGNPVELLEILQKNIAIKEKVVEKDPHEKNLRKALNLGHTIGHAFEALSFNINYSDLPHGFAVAHGLVAESVLSAMLEGFDHTLLHNLARYVRENYGIFPLQCSQYKHLVDYMRQDKKNADAQHINFTLLGAPGQILIDREIPVPEIYKALDIYRDLMGQ